MKTAEIIHDMNDPVRNPITAGFGQSLRDGWAGLTYSARTTKDLSYATLSAVLEGDWPSARLYGTALLTGITEGWIKEGGLAVGKSVIAMFDPENWRQTGKIWWQTVKDRWAGRRGAWDVVFTTLNLLALVLGLYAGGRSIYRRVRPAEVDIASVGEVDPVLIEEVRQGWEQVLPRDVPPDWEVRIPQDTIALQSTRMLVESVPKTDLVEAAQQAKIALFHGEQTPLDGILSPEAFQYIDEIARTQVFGEGENLIIGKHDGQNAGYIGAARTEGGLYYNTHPEVYATLKAAFGDQAGDVAWLINQRVLELYAYERPPVFSNRGPKPLISKEAEIAGKIIENPYDLELIQTYPNARFNEIRWLEIYGFRAEPLYNKVGEIIGYKFNPPEMVP